MAADKKVKYPKFTSPKGAFKYPKLSEPDYGSKDYPKPDGEYAVQLVLPADAPETEAFLAKLKPLYDQALSSAAEEFKKLKVDTRKKLGKVTLNDLFTTVYDQETEEPTGDLSFKFAMPAGGTYKKGPKEGKTWTAQPDLFDAKGQPLAADVSIWGGTVGRVSFEASPYFIPGTGVAGLKLRLRAVQIIDLVSAGQRSAKSHGFDEEDGYEGTASRLDDEFGDQGEAVATKVNGEAEDF